MDKKIQKLIEGLRSIEGRVYAASKDTKAAQKEFDRIVADCAAAANIIETLTKPG